MIGCLECSKIGKFFERFFFFLVKQRSELKIDTNTHNGAFLDDTMQYFFIRKKCINFKIIPAFIDTIETN